MEEPQTKCVNCGEERAAKDCKLCFSVLVCADCNEKANIIYDRARTELRTLLTLLQETIRIALIEGRLSFAAEPSAPAARAEVLRVILGLMESNDGKRAVAVHRPAGVRVPNEVPVSGVPGHRCGMAHRNGGVATRFDYSDGSVESKDRAVPDLLSASDDGHEGAGPAARR